MTSFEVLLLSAGRWVLRGIEDGVIFFPSCIPLNRSTYTRPAQSPSLSNSLTLHATTELCVNFVTFTTIFQSRLWDQVDGHRRCVFTIASNAYKLAFLHTNTIPELRRLNCHVSTISMLRMAFLVGLAAKDQGDVSFWPNTFNVYTFDSRGVSYGS